MTNEEVIEILSDVGDINRCCAEDAEALDMAIKALEQQPCEDCISRQAVLDLVNADWKYEGLETDVASLPSVTPKAGRWEWVQYDANPEIGNFHCSECRYIPASFNMSAQKLNFCPNCGAKMEG